MRQMISDGGKRPLHVLEIIAVVKVRPHRKRAVTEDIEFKAKFRLALFLNSRFPLFVG
jgi:hypothetical protein